MRRETPSVGGRAMTAALDVPGAAPRTRDLLALQALAVPMPAVARMLFVVDFRPSMLCGRTRAFRSVAAAEAVVLLGAAACAAGAEVGLLTLGCGTAVTLSARPRPIREIVAGLVRAHEAASAHALAGRLDDPPLARALSGLGRLAAPGSAVIIVSGFETPGAGLGACLARLAEEHRLQLFQIADGAAAGEARSDIAGLPAEVLNASHPPEAIAARLAALVQRAH
ncbi:hypothetical protein Q4543_07170 [Salipiger sp. 1_MG-2023]|nr:hypothetical protein [Salipiger sp. 1_MG-2023]